MDISKARCLLGYRAGKTILVWIPGQHERGRGNEKAYGCAIVRNCARNRLVLRTTPIHLSIPRNQNGTIVEDRLVKRESCIRKKQHSERRCEMAFVFRRDASGGKHRLASSSVQTHCALKGTPLPVKGGLQREALMFDLLLGHIHVAIRALLTRHQAGHTRNLPSRHHMPQLLREA